MNNNTLNETYRFCYSIGSDVIEIKQHRLNSHMFNRRKGFEGSKGIVTKGGSSSLLSIVEQNEQNSLWLSLETKSSQHLMDITATLGQSCGLVAKKASQLSESIRLSERFGSYARKQTLDLMR